MIDYVTFLSVNASRRRQKPVSDPEGCFSLECTVYIRNSDVGTPTSDSESFCDGHRLHTLASPKPWRVSSFWFTESKSARRESQPG